MQYLFGHFWMWGLGALALGIVVGFAFARRKSGQTPSQGRAWLMIYVVVLALGVALAALKAIKGLNGLWFESFVGLAIAYVVGCLIGALVHGEGSQADLALAGAAACAGAGGSAENLAMRAEALARSTQDAMAQETAAQEAGAVAAAMDPRAAMPAPPVENEDAIAGTRPPGFQAAAGAPDNLKLISGIGPQNESRLNALGIWHFAQIAAWTPENVEWVGTYLAFPGRIEREHWVAQAAKLAAGEMTDFATRAARGEVPTSKST